MKNLIHTAQALLTLSATALLVACGSGNNTAAIDAGGGSPAPGTDVPVSATTDSAAATEFIRSVVARGEANADTPLVVGDVVLATSETADPAGV
jgi:hypothetical protein